MASMPVSTSKSTAPPPAPEGLQQASLLSGSLPGGSSDTTSITLSGPPPSLVPQPHKKRKARNRRLGANMDDISDESKSIEYRAFEGFLLSRAPPNEDIELTGSEDPILLHALITTSTSNTAHRELHKFRKRPQYLEYFVHLATATLSKGHTDKVFSWCKDAFSWVSHRNKLLRSPKQPPRSKYTRLEAAKQNNMSKKASRGMSAIGSSLNVNTVKGLSSSLNLTTARHPGNKLMPKQLSSIGSSLNIGRKQSKRAVPREISSCSSSFNVGRRSSQGKGPPPAVKKGRILSIQSRIVLDADIKITRDDVEYKAFAVLISLLPSFWRTSRARYVAYRLIVSLWNCVTV